MIKIGIVGSNGIPANYGGLETLVENITNKLENRFEITVYCTKHNRTELPLLYGNTKLSYSNFKANGWQSIPYDIITTLKAIIQNDVVVMMGPGVGFILYINKLYSRKIIVNHGGLEEWKREKYKWYEKLFLYYSTKITAKLSNVNIADNSILCKSLKDNFNVESKIIRYGGNYNYKYDNIQEKYKSIINKEYFVSVSRAQIDNNLHIVIEAFINSRHRLILISNWKIGKYGRELYDKYKDKYDNIMLLNAIYDKNEIGYLREKSTAYIHSHSRCGTAPSLVEAMCQNKYPICFDVDTNRETSFNDSLYFKNSNELKLILDSLTITEINRYSDKNISIIKNKYDWDLIANEYAETFK